MSHLNINGVDKPLDHVYVNIGSVVKEAWEARTRVILHGLTDPLCGIDTYKDTLDLSTGPLIRYIKKLVLTGEENIQTFDISTGTLFRVFIPQPRLPSALGDHCFCTHYQPVVTPRLVGTISGAPSTTGSVDIVDNFASIDDFKSYLAAQYAAGTPVTVWYVLAEPETEQITLPSNLTGIVEGYLTQDGTPSPTSPVYPTANGTLEQGGTYSLDTGAYAIAWGRADTFIGANSISARCYGLPVKSWEIDGNSQQTGTPTPDAPIMPTFCGVRTGNLFNRDSIIYPTGTTIKYFPIKVPDGTYILSSNFPDFDTKDIFFLAGNVSSGTSSSTNGVSLSTTRTRTAENGYVTVAMRYNETRANPADYDIMLNAGSTALPYEPYGYKLSITSAGQTIPVYLGEVPTVRRVKKLVLTGGEEFGRNSSTSTYSLDVDCMGKFGILTALSSHYLGVGNVSAFASMTDKAVCERSNGEQIWIRDTDRTSISDFKSYLAAQYAAGTPVTVWYVLATPETAIVNEPLAKIGDYADTLTSEQAGVILPTNDGNTTISVDTSLAPSKFEVKVHAKAIAP